MAYTGAALWQPILLATLAGGSTSLGALLAILHNPNERQMAGLLGFAMGVMATLSIVELVVRNAVENDTFMVLAGTVLGGMAYYILEPLLPKVDLPQEKALRRLAFELDDVETPPFPSASATRTTSLGHARASSVKAFASPSKAFVSRDTHATRDTEKLVMHELQDSPERHQYQNGHSGPVPEGHSPRSPRSPRLYPQKSAHMLRLGLLMALTMTLHNLPEGFAVAFSAFTPIGPIMALAIAMHNIPEGIIIAATGSRWKALGLATASGLTEPVGALGAMLLFRPFLTAEHLNYVLAATGGLMLAVCAIELWPEARRCRNDRGLALGAALGAAGMLLTLSAERWPAYLELMH